jgi:phospholipase/carboxylesterase
MADLIYAERPAHGDADGLLMLHHGRGADAQDLLGLADVLDPAARLHVVTPQGPLTLPGWGGYHWYQVPQVGYPDHDTFHSSYKLLGDFHDETWERTGIPPERTVFGGFSMGTVMSYATGLGSGRPRPAGIMAFSGFIPTVDDWAPDLTSRAHMPAFIAHGRGDQVISVEFAQKARAELDAAELDVQYLEGPGSHRIDPAAITPATGWLAATL